MGRRKRGKTGDSRQKLLLLLAQEERPMGVTELGHALGLDKSSIAAQLKRLQHVPSLGGSVELVRSEMGDWSLAVYKKDTTHPNDYVLKQNMDFQRWSNVWLSINWTKGQSDRLFATKWWKKNVLPYWDKPPAESKFVHEYTLWSYKVFEFAHKYPELWEKASFKIEKKPKDPYLIMEGPLGGWRA